MPLIACPALSRSLVRFAMSYQPPPFAFAFNSSIAGQLNRNRTNSSSKNRAFQSGANMKSEIASGVRQSTRSRLPRLWLPNTSATHQLGTLLGQDARPSDVILLSGSLGAGKTCFARGYIQTVRGDTAIEVTSPTYLLVNTYPPSFKQKGPTVYHMDLWRLDPGTRRAIVDFSEVFGKHISLIEWPDRLQDELPSERLEVLIEYPERHAEVDENDPWGFGTEDVDGLGSARDGRFATLQPVGRSWEERITKLRDEVAVLDEAGRLVISEQ
ncbi:unnamed protein product [Chondrus crispus]|uniref:tRNA threonylcarbamoyladenosine biosynthesis protein TsaE n=1 Tax=Chondrus crispus TaxID=2769 RepID=R7QHH0_CHOCR|nr:unnamed protein product [Chondrus crispus]CDF37489.1 unnamed protein product [Chondrus crispus]|eukprot:XP_005717360.1 unnamed protein product [Chondrus crispus]